jgi:large subunit ribosomal protein L21
MYVIVDIAGQQFKVEKDQKIFVNRLEGEEGSKIDFDQILLSDDNGNIQVGTPIISNMVVKATILSHLRGETVKVFKKKRRKGYQKLNGHRQYLTQIQIDSISEGKAEAKPMKKAVVKTVKSKAEKVEKVEKPIKTAPKAAPKAKKVVAEKPTKKEVVKKSTKAPAAKKAAEPKKAAAKKSVKKKE